MPPDLSPGGLFDGGTLTKLRALTTGKVLFDALVPQAGNRRRVNRQGSEEDFCMAERDGWWKFHRKLWDNPLFSDDLLAVGAWCWMLSAAEWQEGKSVFFRGKRVYLKPGQFTAGYYQLSKKWRVGRQTVRRIVSAFKTNTLINQESDGTKSLYTVVNWDKYQNDQHSAQHTSNTPPTPLEEGKKGRYISIGPVDSVHNHTPSWICTDCHGTGWKPNREHCACCTGV